MLAHETLTCRTFSCFFVFLDRVIFTFRSFWTSRRGCGRRKLLSLPLPPPPPVYYIVRAFVVVAQRARVQHYPFPLLVDILHLVFFADSRSRAFPLDRVNPLFARTSTRYHVPPFIIIIEFFNVRSFRHIRVDECRRLIHT